MIGITVEYVVVSYAIAFCCKVWGIKKKYLPAIAAVSGGTLGIVCHLLLGVHANWLEALAVGLFSGFSAVGTNEIVKYAFTRKGE